MSERWTEKLERWPRPVGMALMALIAPLSLVVPGVDADRAEIAMWGFVALFAARGAEKVLALRPTRQPKTEDAARHAAGGGE